MNIYAQVGEKLSAISEYRLMTPLSVMDVIEDGPSITVDEFSIRTSEAARLKAFLGSDIFVTHASVASQVYETFEKVKNGVPAYEDGILKVPPAICIDIDDLYTEISHLNPAFGYWGYKRPDGTEMQPGDKITIDTVDAGEITLWEDGKLFNYVKEAKFDLQKNRNKIQRLANMMLQADIVTCSTPRLKAELEALHGREVHVYPNSMVPIDWPDVNVHKPKLTVLWQGGSSHHEDLMEIRDGLEYLSNKYPDIQWIMYGQDFQFIRKAIPADRIIHHSWVPYEMHKLKMATLPHDINIAPLAHTKFNACKSAIKWYESSMLRNPAATIASNWGPFADEMVDGETGMLFDDNDEFVKKMEILIADAELRRTMGLKSKDWVYANRLAGRTAPKLYEVYKETVRKKYETGRRFFPLTGVEQYGVLPSHDFDMGSAKRPRCPRCG